MSGPKVSVYTLTEEQRAAIAEERRKRQREREKRNQLMKSISESVEKVRKHATHLQEYRLIADEARKNLSDVQTSELLESSLSNAKTLVEELNSLKKCNDNARMESRLVELKPKVDALESTEKNVVQLMSTLENQLQSVLSESISDLFEKNDSGGAPAAIESVAVSCAREKITHFLCSGHQDEITQHKLREMLDGLPQAIKSYGEPYIALEVQPFLEKCAETEELWAECGSEYTALINQYLALCSEIGMSSPTIIPFDAKAVARLKCEIAILEAQAQKQAEDAYISQTLTEVMLDMGYTVWGNRSGCKKNGQHYINDLFRFSEETAVSVTCSSDGQVALELGKVDYCDRLPSPIEGESLEKQMDLFCTQFREIEQRLAARGVILGSRLMMAPPSSDFAQIININDYTVVDQQADTKKQLHKKKRALQLDSV